MNVRVKDSPLHDVSGGLFARVRSQVAKSWRKSKEAVVRSVRNCAYRLAGGRKELILSPHYSGIRGVISIRREASILSRNKRHFKAVADTAKVIWVDPSTILYKLDFDLDIYFNDILSGDWDLQRRASLQNVAKHRSIHQRFVQGWDWKDTDLFRKKYAKRFGRGEKIRGADNADDLAVLYSSEIDALFENMKQNGFVIRRDPTGRLHSLPHLHIGRTGELILGNNGNHRVAIAKVLRLGRIPCWIRSRHLYWQRVRDEIAASLTRTPRMPLDPKFASHPDLADILVSGADHTKEG